jgi:hypothetical protein
MNKETFTKLTELLDKAMSTSRPDAGSAFEFCRIIKANNILADLIFDTQVLPSITGTTATVPSLTAKPSVPVKVIMRFPAMKTAQDLLDKLGYKNEQVLNFDATHKMCVKIWPNEPGKVERKVFYLFDVEDNSWTASNVLNRTKKGEQVTWFTSSGLQTVIDKYVGVK